MGFQVHFDVLDAFSSNFLNIMTSGKINYDKTTVTKLKG